MWPDLDSLDPYGYVSANVYMSNGLKFNKGWRPFTALEGGELAHLPYIFAYHFYDQCTGKQLPWRYAVVKYDSNVNKWQYTSKDGQWFDNNNLKAVKYYLPLYEPSYA